MQDQSKAQGQGEEATEWHPLQTQQTILTLLLCDRQSVWSVAELVAEIERELDVIDSLDELKAAGLIHRCGEFVFATRAAIRFWEVEEH